MKLINFSEYHKKNYPNHDLELATVIHALKASMHYLYSEKCGI